MDTLLALAALAVSLVALGMSVFFWRRQFRPIVTAAVKTHSGGNDGIAYNLVVLNSGSIPAKNIRLIVHDQAGLKAALGVGANEDAKKRWLACFTQSTEIPLLQNGDKTTCSFGMTHSDPRQSFWKPQAQFWIRIEYEGWFGAKYDSDPLNVLQIADSDNFTGGMWAPVRNPPPGTAGTSQTGSKLRFRPPSSIPRASPQRPVRHPRSTRYYRPSS